MKNLQKLLTEWVGEGLLTSDQEQHILKFEESKTKALKSKWVLYGFIILGVCVLGIGIISLIAANWEKIPPAVKLTNNLLILSGIAYAAYVMDRRSKDIPFDAVSSLFILVCLSTIGLISQVFHTGGELYQALLFWLVIIFPLSMLSKRNFLPNLWIAGFLIMLMLFAVSSKSWWEQVYYRHDCIALMFMLPYFCFFMGTLLTKISILERYGRIFSVWSLIAFFATLAMTDSILGSYKSGILFQVFIPAYIFAALSLIVLYLKSDFLFKERVLITIIILVSSAISILVLEFSDLDMKYCGKVIGAGYVILMLILFSMIFIIRDNRKLFNIITLLIGIRFLIVYFQVFKNLATTGFGLIISGLVIIGLSILWFKKRDDLELWLGERLK